MQIFVSGYANRDVAPDQIVASVTFSAHEDTYDEALKTGVKTVKEYLEFIAENTDFDINDFKTHSYNIRESFHYNTLEAKTEDDLNKQLRKRVSDGFFFSQYAYVEFDYDKNKLSQLLVLTSKTPNAPAFHIDFALKDRSAIQRDLLGEAYENARLKAETLATAAGKHLRDCVRVTIDGTSGYSDYGVGYNAKRSSVMYDSAIMASERETINEEIKAIDDSFHPDDIPVSKSIDCTWETSD